MIALILPGIAPLHHILAIGSDGGSGEFGGTRVVPYKTCWRRKGQVHQVVEDEDLSIAVHAGSDADGGNRKLRRDLRSELARHALEHDNARTSVLQVARLLAQASVPGSGLALHLVAAH